ncbi:MAG TPA: PBP1A family penicillin-binding protein [Candidatus Babeliales bacterium]|nr:PBP1A family penicillin-binding protein [Candidatus Babeliales bacterium]
MSTILYRFFIVCVLIASTILGGIWFITHNKCIDFSVLEYYQAGQPSIVLDDEGHEWTRFQLDRREPIPLEKMPKHLIQAFIAAEDWRFFEHAGISWKGIIRSALVNLYHGRKVQGASTITQQLVRLLYFDAKKTFSRKIKEQLVAIMVEAQFTKEQILETYLNHVCFGCGIYGVEAACQRFWGKKAADISLDEAAVLAAIMRSPSRYCPIINPLSAEKRRDVILHSMRKLNIITQEEYELAKSLPVKVKDQDEPFAPHMKEMIRIFLEEQVGKTALYNGGLIIQTTLNRALQEKAQRAFARQFKQLRSGPLAGIDGALMSLDTKTGEIKALIGGYNFAKSKFNRATQARRQMGSTFKPLVYAAAIKAGMHFTDTDIDEPIELKQSNGVWSPNNAFDQFEGEMTLAWALSTSNNIIAIKTFMQVGAQPIIDLAKRCHLQGLLLPYPSLALGCVDATLKEVAGTFNIFANDGVYAQPHFIQWIKDRWGSKIWRSAPCTERVISSVDCGQVTKVLELSLKRVQETTKQEWIESDAISKTGTTNDFRTCWFAGSTPDLTTVIYIGRDDNQPIGAHMFPLKTAFPIWLEIYRDLPINQKHFSYDPSLQECLINKKTGRQTHSSDKEMIAVFI